MDQPTPQQPDDSLEHLVEDIHRKKEEDLAKKKAQTLELEYRNMTGFQPNPTVVGLVSKDIAAANKIFAFEKEGNKVFLAVTDPEQPNTAAMLAKLAQAHDDIVFVWVLVSESSMAYLLSVYDTFAPATYKQPDVKVSSESQAAFVSQFTNLKEFGENLAKVSTGDLLDTLFAGATALDASDIHIEPTGSAMRIRYRLDGVLQDIADLPTAQVEPLIDRIKIMAELKLNINQSSQDGRFTIHVGNGTYDIRVSLLPTQYGESAVMRLLPQTGKFVALNELGLNEQQQALIDTAIHQPNGLVLNTGPTGSGKTTTLYAVLNTINSPTTKIITIEDPIEYRLEGITQTQINKDEHYDFANALRSIVRQDPDVILVGEIRDGETADIAIDASLTGHLVLSTVHTNDAAGAIPRLIDLGAKPALFSDALRLIIAQRLVRKACPDCRTQSAPTPAEVEQLTKLAGDTIAIPAQLVRVGSCDKCNGTGYKGRIGLFEIMAITPELKTSIANGAPAHEIRQLAISQGMTTLTQDGIAKLANGTTTLEELLRIIES